MVCTVSQNTLFLLYQKDIKASLDKRNSGRLWWGEGVVCAVPRLSAAFLSRSGQDMVSILQLVQNLMHGDEDEQPQSTR